MNHFGKIPTLLVDLSPFCDLKCIMCPQGRMERGKRYVMEDSTIDSIIDGLISHREGVDVILPFWNGEPLYSKNFNKFIDELIKNKKNGLNFDSISIHTNCTNLTEDISKKIINSGVFSTPTFSIDGATSETYEKIRRGSNFEKVRQNIERFIKIRSEHNKKLPNIIIQFIVMEENIDEVALFKKYWSNFLKKFNSPFEIIYDDTNLTFDKDYIFIRKLIPDEETEEKLELVNRLHQKAMEKIPEKDVFCTELNKISIKVDKARRPCPGIFKHLGIKYNGDTSPCCRDFEAKINIGNVNEESIHKIWTGELLKEYRIAHIEGRFNDVPLCGECGGQPFGYISDNEIIEFLKSIGEEKLINPYMKRMGII